MALFDTEDLDLISGKKQKKIVPKQEVKQVPKLNVTYNDLVHLNREFRADNYDDFTKDKYPDGLVFYDFEVFSYDWLVVLIDPVNKTKTIIANNKHGLEEYYENHKDMIWVGYNNLHYDVPILKGILLGLNAKEISDQIIVEQKSNFQIFGKLYDRYQKMKLLSYDVFDGVNSLKVLEAFMGNDICETEVPFDIPRLLTQEEINLTCKYCIHDVEQTIEVFRLRVNDFNASMNLITLFGLDLEKIRYTKAQLTADIIGCEKRDRDGSDSFDLTFVDTLRLNKYKYVQDWFIEACKNKDYSAKLETTVCGVPHIFGWGGVHGAPDKPIHRKGRIFHVDVTSYYPSIMIRYDMLTRNCKDKNKFKDVYDTRVELKKQGKKKEQAPYKIILNSTYGICKDKYSTAYDPVQANNVCVNGQLMLLDLLEHLEGKASIIQSNTDGIILQIRDNDEAEKEMRDICNEWIQRTGMGLGFDAIKEIHQGDVNNYVFVFDNGKVERKGAYVKELSELDNDLPIVNEAITNYIVKGIDPEETINGCNEFIKFQKVVRISSSYKYAMHNGKKLNDRTFRVFASKDKNDGFIGRCKYEGATVEKFGNTPDHCFVYNKQVKDVPMSIKIDKEWYIDLTKKRLSDKFGFYFTPKGGLF